MASSTFVPEVKERQSNEPCFVVLNTDQDVGLGQKQIIFDLPDIKQAEEFAKMLRGFRATVRIG